MRAFLLSILVLGGCFGDDPPATSQASQAVYSHECNSLCGHSEGLDCCKLVNCFNRAGWDNGCKPPLRCDRTQHSGNGQGKCVQAASQ